MITTSSSLVFTTLVIFNPVPEMISEKKIQLYTRKIAFLIHLLAAHVPSFWKLDLVHL